MEDRENKDPVMSDTNPTSSASDTPADLGATTAIGRRLKAYYDDVASEPVPDRFMSLLDALDAAETKAKGGN